MGPRDQVQVGRLGGQYSHTVTYPTDPNFLSPESLGPVSWVPGQPDLHRGPTYSNTDRGQARPLWRTEHTAHPHVFTKCHSWTENYCNKSFNRRFVFCVHVTVFYNTQTSISERLQTLSSRGRLQLFTELVNGMSFPSIPPDPRRAPCFHGVLQPLRHANAHLTCRTSDHWQLWEHTNHSPRFRVRDLLLSQRKRNPKIHIYRSSAFS